MWPSSCPSDLQKKAKLRFRAVQFFPGWGSRRRRAVRRETSSKPFTVESLYVVPLLARSIVHLDVAGRAHDRRVEILHGKEIAVIVRIAPMNDQRLPAPNSVPENSSSETGAMRERKRQLLQETGFVMIELTPFSDWRRRRLA